MNLSKKKLQDLKDKKISLNDLEKKSIIYIYETRVRAENVLKLLTNDICSFKDLVDKFKSMRYKDSTVGLEKLLGTEDLFKELIENNKLTEDDLKYLWNKIDDWHELNRFNRNSTLLRYIVDTDIISFKDIVDKFKSMPNIVTGLSCLYDLLDKKKLFNELIENNKITNDDLKYLLNKIDTFREVYRIFHENDSLVKKILNELVLDKVLVDRFNTIIEEGMNDSRFRYNYAAFFIKYNSRTVFDIIKHTFTNVDKEILKLNALNRYTHDSTFELEQQHELVELLKNSEQAKSTLIQILDSNLEDQYDFESLKNLLTKNEQKRKNKLNL